MISVIVPIYKSEKYLERCIKSILSQTYKDYELILIDDGSPDLCPQICDRYKKEYNNIKVVHKKNGGVSSARNYGIKISKGDFITFVDSDDYIEENFLLEAINKIRNYDLYISGLIMENFDNKKIEYKNSKSKVMTVNELLENIDITYPQICICGPWCKLYKNNIIKSNNILFDENINLGEDTLFNIKYYEKMKNVYFDEKIFYHYVRENNESLFSTFSPNTYELHTYIYDKMRNLLINAKCSKEGINNFERIYLGLMIGCIHQIFKNSKDKSKKMEVIDKVISNKFIEKVDIKEYISKRKRENFVIKLIKSKKRFILYFIFSLKYIGVKS